MDNNIGQVSMNFVMLIGILLVVFFVFGIIYFNQLNILSKKQEFLAAQDMAEALRKEVLIAAEASEGYNREFNVKPTLDGIDYSIIINGTILNIVTARESASLKIPEISGDFRKELNSIRKENGQIILN